MEKVIDEEYLDLLIFTLQRNNSALTGADINRLLIRGANRKSDVLYPNRTWGYGTIDLYGFFLKLI